MTTKLTAPNGVTVSVADEKAESLIARGFASETKKAPAKKAASSSKSEK